MLIFSSFLISVSIILKLQPCTRVFIHLSHSVDEMRINNYIEVVIIRPVHQNWLLSFKDTHDKYCTNSSPIISTFTSILETYFVWPFDNFLSIFFFFPLFLKISKNFIKDLFRHVTRVERGGGLPCPFWKLKKSALILEKIPWLYSCIG